MPDKGIRPLGQVLRVLIRVESRVSNIHMILSKVLREQRVSNEACFLFENITSVHYGGGEVLRQI